MKIFLEENIIANDLIESIFLCIGHNEELYKFNVVSMVIG